ncbi:hypothetical protein ACJX0J_017334, partial [Zea mays]
MNMFNEFINLYKLREIARGALSILGLIIKFLVSTETIFPKIGTKDIEKNNILHNHVLRENFWEGRSELSIIKQAIDLMHVDSAPGPNGNILEGVVILHEKAYDKWRMGKQGDPLSPLLFNLVFVYLSLIITLTQLMNECLLVKWIWKIVKHLFKWGAINKVWDELLTHGRDEVVWVLDISKTFTTQSLKDIYKNIWNDRCALCQKQETWKRCSVAGVKHGLGLMAESSPAALFMLEKKVEEVHIRKTLAIWNFPFNMGLHIFTIKGKRKLFLKKNDKIHVGVGGFSVPDSSRHT